MSREALFEKKVGKWQGSCRTRFELLDDDRLTITAYNVSPEGDAARVVETTYRRVG